MRNTWMVAAALVLGSVAPAIACGGACDGEAKAKAGCEEKAGCEGEVAKKKAGCEEKAGCEGEVAKKKDDCEGGACEQTASLGATYEKLMGRAKQGCDASKAQMAHLNAALGVKGDKEGAEAIAKLEEAAAKGCKESKGKLTKLAMMTKLMAMPLSKQVATMSAAAGKGCETSKGRLAALGANCEGSTKALIAKISDLEAKAAKGCKESGALLASMRGKLMPISAAPAAAPKAKMGGCESGDKAGCESGDKAGCGGEQAKAKPKAKMGGCGGCEDGAAAAPVRKSRDKSKGEDGKVFH